MEHNSKKMKIKIDILTQNISGNECGNEIQFNKHPPVQHPVSMKESADSWLSTEVDTKWSYTASSPLLCQFSWHLSFFGNLEGGKHLGNNFKQYFNCLYLMPIPHIG